MLGAGAIGGSVGADLTEAGYDVTIVDQWPANVEAMKAGGLRIAMTDGGLDTPVSACHLCDLAALGRVFDIALLTVKSYDTRWMVEIIKDHLKADGVLVGIQNSLNDDAIASIIGRKRTIGCVVELSAEIFTPGVVRRNTPPSGTWFALGELNGSITPRLEEIASILGRVGTVDMTANIHGAKWTKLITNAMMMGPFGLLGLPDWEATELPGMFDISATLGREALAVGTALGYRIEPIFGLRPEEFAGSSDDVLVKVMTTLRSHLGPGSRTATIQDHLKGRTSEIEFINGLVMRKGREAGISTPYNEAVVAMDREISKGVLTMDPSNLGRLRARLNLA